ncbi:MAG: enoyl-CoA hydratase-related protein [Nocardioides sp.]|nr:enoyl-CoA hydratase-related protein [Nocardioides sp.]
MTDTDQAPTQGLAVTEDDGVLTVCFNRPEAFNAFTGEMVLETASLLEQANARDDIRVVVLTGAGPAFSAGADVAGDDASERFDVHAMDAANRLVRAIVQCDKPVVGAVNGIAAGVGLSVALACDVIVAKQSASFLLVFTRIGLMPDGGVVATMSASLGRTRTMASALLGEPIPAQAAYDAGLVSHLTTDEDFDDRVEKLVTRLRHGAPLAQSATKRAVNAASLGALEAALENERSTQTMLLRTADAAEGMRAFSEKRRPTFWGE